MRTSTSAREQLDKLSVTGTTQSLTGERGRVGGEEGEREGGRAKRRERDLFSNVTLSQ